MSIPVVTITVLDRLAMEYYQQKDETPDLMQKSCCWNNLGFLTTPAEPQASMLCCINVVIYAKAAWNCRVFISCKPKANSRDTRTWNISVWIWLWGSCCSTGSVAASDLESVALIPASSLCHILMWPWARHLKPSYPLVYVLRYKHVSVCACNTVNVSLV